MKRLLTLAVLLLAPAALAVNFFSYRLFTGSGLPAGYALGNLNLLGPQKSFPGGRQLVAVTSLSFPYSQKTDTPSPFQNYQKELLPLRKQTHVIYTASGSPADRERSGTRLPQSLTEVTNIKALQGPWNIWLDPTGRLASQAAAKSQIGDTDSWGTLSLLACVENGRVTSTYQDYLLKYPMSGRFVTVAQRCIRRGVSRDQVALPFRARVRPDFRLKDSSGKTIEGENQRGPYALLTLLPDNAYNLDVQKLYQVAVQTLKIADIPAHVVALPYVSATGEFVDTGSVAASLRKALDVPVYTDAGGNFLDVMSNHLAQPSMILLFGRKGELLDAFAVNNGPYDLPNTLAQALVEYDLF